jgi:tetratricopeptide (TPR) repeat protein
LQNKVMALEVARSYNETITEARSAEAGDDLEKAAKLYERAVRLQPHEEMPYNRLMIIYRKLYRYEDELKVIEKGIKSFEDFYKDRAQKIVSKNKVAEQLSKSLAKSLGLTDRKGNEVYHPGPIDSWLKRKAVVEKKLGKTPSVKKAKKTAKKGAKPK